MGLANLHMVDIRLADLHGIVRLPWDWLIGVGLTFDRNFGIVLTLIWIGIVSAKD